MARRKIAEFAAGNRLVKVYRDSEWEEYRVRLYVDGRLNESADCFASDKEDAIGTAREMVAQSPKASPDLVSGVIQDGAQFYRESDGTLLASYPGTVRNDGDMSGAVEARVRFVTDFPEYAYFRATD